MLLIVFGAGASYDSSTVYPPDRLSSLHRPPLANQLFEFDYRPKYAEAVNNLGPHFQAIIHRLRLVTAPQTIEGALEKLRDEEKTNPERTRQLAAVRFYLRYVLEESGREWLRQISGATNYQVLMDCIQHWLPDNTRVSLVTFNYDTMIDDAMPVVGISLRQIDDYVANERYKLIKLHGSINWVRKFDNQTIYRQLADNEWEAARLIVEHAPQALGDEYRLISSRSHSKLDNRVLFPAIAIPVEKKYAFECPIGHLQTLKECLPHVTKMLIVGWRGAEEHFAKLLVEQLPHTMQTLVVSAHASDASEVIKRLQNFGIKGTFRPSEFGFSGFVQNEAEAFLGC